MESYNFLFNVIFLSAFIKTSLPEDIFGCGGFVKSSFSINYSRVEVKLYTKQGSLKYQTDCAPHNGYYLIPLYDKGDYVLKIEPPAGWDFEPSSVALHVDGTTDPCSRNQDINFNFKGFTVSGKVLSYDQGDGPAGINLVLKNSAGDILQETVSLDDGSYSFAPVLPGSYIIEGSHKKWLFNEKSEHIKVEQDNVKALNKILVAGFDVTGHVSSEGEPIQGVHFLLFSKHKLKKAVTGCKNEAVRGFGVRQELHYLCYATSLTDGSFFFPSLPSGKYTLVPFHKGEHIEFDVSPPEVEFEVKQSSFIFPNSFQVEGFSVSGRVLEVANGKGLEGSDIYINGKLYTKTEARGVYHLENMRAGMYEIEVKMPHIFFDKVTMKVTPNTPHLPEIFASKFSICGHVLIEQYPPSLSEVERIVTLKSVESNTIVNVPVQEEGDFCTVASSGKYVIEPVVSDIEKNNGLQFVPSKHDIHLKHQPLLDILFTQFLAIVTGQIKCIEKCGPLKVSITSLINDGIHFSTTTAEDGVFQIKGCLPGRYLLRVNKEDWCFQSRSIEFNVVDKDVTDLKLQQLGFHATLTVSHTSSFKVKYPSGEIHILSVQNGRSVLCMPESGVYDFVPVGCHLYKSEVFKFDTKNPADINLTPFKYLVTGNVLAELNVSDIAVSIDRQTNGNPEIIHLKEPVEVKKNTFRYTFSVFVEPNTELEIKVTSSTLLFRPAVAYVKVIDDCIDNAVEIIGKKGLFIDGSISPTLEDVTVKILDKKNNTVISEVVTDKSGKFVVGPLDDEHDYIVTAEKEGFFFTHHGKLGSFKAYKLAEIVVKVQNENGNPLSGVLLSLSGGVDYRKNSLTRKDGKVSFIGLSPGQYFLRPMLKEYHFQPTTKMIDIKEGTQIDVKISGKRVAYSLFGVVNSLTGESEVGVAVEAVGINEPCRQYQEDAISEQGGTFRIRGLQPGCEYRLRLKKGNDVNQHIERATPEEHILKVENGDIKDVRIIVFRHFSQLDVSGSVFTNQDYLSTLKVRLYNDENPDQVIHTITLGRSAFFFLPSMPIDNKIYTLRLDSSLSTNAYQYTTPSETFCANTSFYHFTFSFRPQPKSTDQEVTQGSILALPLTILVIVIVYNYTKCLNIVMQLLQSVSSVIGPVRSSHSTDNLSTENANGRRKLKSRKAQ